MPKRLAIVGGGPSALFLLRRLVDKNLEDVAVDIFERNSELGPGFPYSRDGSDSEHVTNVSGNEIPDLEESLSDWVRKRSAEPYQNDQIDLNHFSDYQVVPRLLFGEYLGDQFSAYIKKAGEIGMPVHLHRGITVTRLSDQDAEGVLSVSSFSQSFGGYDYVIVCTGHHWPVKEEGKLKNHFDSPYPPVKLKSLTNLPVNIKGSSLTAIDAIKTIARANGEFGRDDSGKLRFSLKNECPSFRINMHSRHGILPGLRFHLEDPHLAKDALLSKTAIDLHRRQNSGFISLDYIFEQNFKRQFEKSDPAFFKLIKEMTMEQFVGSGISSFNSDDPFVLFASEYADSLRSIRDKKSEYWKEKLAILSIAMNYPAKYLSAEDKLRFDEHLMPLISVVIAFVPQRSAEELLALHNAGLLFLDTSVGDQEDANAAFVDCTGQPHLWLKDFIFQDLVVSGAVCQAKLNYQFEDKKLDVPGLAITDHFRAVTEAGLPHPNLFIMAVPYIGGFNPDYSGLDFCEDAAKAIVDDLIGMNTPVAAPAME